MKKKSFEKKLTLSKSTVANLEGSQMGNIMGGIFETKKCIFTTDIGDPICLSYIECPCSEWLDCVHTQNTSCHI